MGGGEAHVLHVFDFDGTLFRSPVPHPDRHDGREHGSLLGEHGWFSTAATLAPPAVPAVPGKEWWVADIVAAARAALAAAACGGELYVVLLTGRVDSVPFRERIGALLDGAGLAFHEVHLKPAGAGGTFEWKAALIEGLIARRGGAGRVVIYEDRPRHAHRFHQLCEDKQWRGEVVRVTEPAMYLDEDVEREVAAAVREHRAAAKPAKARKANPLEGHVEAEWCQGVLRAFADDAGAAELRLEDLSADQKKLLYYFGQSRAFPFRTQLLVMPCGGDAGQRAPGVILKKHPSALAPETTAFDAAVAVFAAADAPDTHTFTGLDRHARAALYLAVERHGLTYQTRRCVGGDGLKEVTIRRLTRR